MPPGSPRLGGGVAGSGGAGGSGLGSVPGNAAGSGTTNNAPAAYSGPSCFVYIIGTLNALKECIDCPVISHLMACIQVDARTWQLLHRPIYDDLDVLRELTRLQDALYELVKKLNRHAGSGKLTTLIGSTNLAEEASFTQKVLDRASAVHKLVHSKIVAFHEKVHAYQELALKKRSVANQGKESIDGPFDSMPAGDIRGLGPDSNPRESFSLDGSAGRLDAQKDQLLTSQERFSTSNALSLAHAAVLARVIPAPLCTLLSPTQSPLFFSPKVIYRMTLSKLVELEASEKARLARIQAAEQVAKRKAKKQRQNERRSWWLKGRIMDGSAMAALQNNGGTAKEPADLADLLSVHEQTGPESKSAGSAAQSSEAWDANESSSRDPLPTTERQGSAYSQASTLGKREKDAAEAPVNDGVDDDDDDDDDEEDDDDEDRLHDDEVFGKLILVNRAKDGGSQGTTFSINTRALMRMDFASDILEHESTRTVQTRFVEDKRNLAYKQQNLWQDFGDEGHSQNSLAEAQYRRQLETLDTFSEEEDETSAKVVDGPVATPGQIEYQVNRLRELLLKPKYTFQGITSSAFPTLGQKGENEQPTVNQFEGLIPDLNLRRDIGQKWACGELTDQVNWVPQFLFPGAVPDLYGIGPIPGGSFTPDLLLRTAEDEAAEAEILGLPAPPPPSGETGSASDRTEGPKNPADPEALIADPLTEESVEPEVLYSPARLGVQSLSAWMNPSTALLTWLRSHYMTLGLHAEILRAMWWLYTAAALAQVTQQALAVLCDDEPKFKEAVRACERTAALAVRSAIPQTASLLKIDPLILPQNIFALTFNGIERGPHYRIMRQLVRELRLAHDIFAAADIHLFPSQIQCHRGTIKALAVSQLSPHYVLSGGADGTLRIWDTVTKLCLAQFVGHTSAISWCTFLSFDASIVSASLDGTVRVWDSKTANCLRVLAGHRDSILACAMSSKQQFLVTASMDCTLRVWIVSSGLCLSLLEGHRNWVTSVAFGSNDQTIVSCGLDRQILVWPFKGIGVGLGAGSGTNSVQAIISVPVHSERVIDIVACPRMRFLTAARDGTLCVWRAHGPSSNSPAVAAAAAPTTRARLRLNGTLDHNAASALLNEPYTVEATLPNPSKSTVSSMALSVDHKLVAAAMLDCSVNIYELSTYALLRSVKIHSAGIAKLVWATNRSLFVGTTDGYILVINL